MIIVCPDCGSDQLRTFSFFNKDTDKWEWRKGCNLCDWEGRDVDEEKKHPEYYKREEISPAKIKKSDNLHR